MTNDKAPMSAVVLLILSAVVGAGAVLFTSGFLTEYGTTSGSWKQGAVDGLKGAVVPLLLTGALAAAAFGSGRRSSRVRGLAVAVLVLSTVGVLVAGAQAAVSKYDRQALLPNCLDEEAVGSPAEPVLRAADEAFSHLKHPDRFSGGGSSGIYGCSTFLLNVTFDEAAAHYRDELPAAGWAVVRDEDARLKARRDDLVFVLAKDRWGSGMVAIAIKPATPVALPEDP